MRVLVTGGTARLGPSVVRRLRDAGCTVRVLSRRPPADASYVQGDLRSGVGLDAAVRDIDTVIHCASSPNRDPELTRNLLAALGSRPAVRILYVSIVGIDRVNMMYYRGKLASEQLIMSSGLQWTIQRATQFHQLILGAARPLSRLPVVPVPRDLRLQPVAADDVAARLVEITLAGDTGRMPDMAGPHVRTFEELVRAYLRQRERRRPVLPIWLPGLATVRAGGLLPSGDHRTGSTTWEDFLTSSS